MRWNESHSASRLPPILLCCLSPVPLRPRPPFSSRSLNPPTTSESLFHSGSLSLSLFSAIYGSTFLLLSLLYQPSTLFLVLSLPAPSRLPATRTRESRGARYTHVHTCSRTYGSKVFARGGQYSPTTRTTPSRPEGGKRERVRMAEEIRFYPAAVAETFFPYLGITSKLE